MVRPKFLCAVALSAVAVAGMSLSAQAHPRRGYSGHQRYSFIPTYYPGPPWYPGPAFYGPLRYGSPYGYFYRDRTVYRSYW